MLRRNGRRVDDRVAMSFFRARPRGRGPKTAAFCLAAGLGVTSAAFAQGAAALRGTLPDDATDPATVSSIADGYQPASDGALPDDAAATTDDTRATNAGDPFADRGAAASSAPDTTTSQAQTDSGGASRDEKPQDSDEARIRRIDTREAPVNRPAEVDSERQGAVTASLRPKTDEPFAPLGLRVGTFTVFPQIEQGLTATDNADQSPTGRSAILSESTLRLKAVSDWSSSEASIEGYGTLRRTLSGQDVTDFQGALNSDLRLDITSSLRGLASLDYTVFPEDASSPVSIAGVDRRPLHHVLSASLGAEKDLGKLRLRLTGDIVRDQFGDARLDDGTTLSQDDRNATLASFKLRGGYEISPAVTPFVEAEAGRRFYDRKEDASGYARSADRLAARAGVALDLREKLTGEISAGWVNESPDDERLKTISGPSLAAALVWSPMRETTLRLDTATYVEGTTTPGETGSILYTGLLTAERRMRADLTGTAALGLGYRTYDTGGHDTLASAELGLTWWLNRYAGVTGRARYELLRSDLADRDYDAASVFLGMTVQR